MKNVGLNNCKSVLFCLYVLDFQPNAHLAPLQEELCALVIQPQLICRHSLREHAFLVIVVVLITHSPVACAASGNKVLSPQLPVAGVRDNVRSVPGILLFAYQHCFLAARAQSCLGFTIQTRPALLAHPAGWLAALAVSLIGRNRAVLAQLLADFLVDSLAHSVLLKKGYSPKPNSFSFTACWERVVSYMITALS